MHKIFNALIEVFYWLTLFGCPFLITGVIALVIYIKNEDLLWLSIIIISIGTLAGILFAERIRKKYGCSDYVGKIFGS